MAELPANTNASKRRPALRGVVMQDVSQGQERTRKWPEPRGKAKTKADQKRQDDFRIYQLASKYIAPQLYCDVIAATEGTPLLPRDLLTMQFSNRLLAFILPDGKVLWPVTARRDVSLALDTISQTVGTILVRREEGWVAEPKPGGSGSSALTIIEDWVAEGGEPQKTFLGIPQGFRDLVLVVNGKTNAATFANVTMRLNGDAAANYDVQRNYMANTTTSTDRASAQTAWGPLFALTGTDDKLANSASTMSMEIFDYANPNFSKTALWRAVQASTTTVPDVMYVMTGGANYRAVAPIASVEVILSANGFAAGSTVTLYGRGER